MIYAQESGGNGLLMQCNDGKEDLDIDKVWKWMGAEG